MAGSYQHCIDESGQLLEEPLLDHMGDALEVIEHMYHMIQALSKDDGARIKDASDEAYERMYPHLKKNASNSCSPAPAKDPQ